MLRPLQQPSPSCARLDWLEDYMGRLESGMLLVRPFPRDLLNGVRVRGAAWGLKCCGIFTLLHTHIAASRRSGGLGSSEAGWCGRCRPAGCRGLA